MNIDVVARLRPYLTKDRTSTTGERYGHLEVDRSNNRITNVIGGSSFTYVTSIKLPERREYIGKIFLDFHERVSAITSNCSSVLSLTRHRMEQAMRIGIWEEWDIKARLGHHLGNVRGWWRGQGVGAGVGTVCEGWHEAAWFAFWVGYFYG